MSETPTYIFTNPECTLGIIEMKDNQFGDLVYEPTRIEDTCVISSDNSSGEFHVVFENTIVMKKYFDAALRVCSACSVNGHMDRDKVEILISKTPFSPVAFRIYQGPFHILVAPIVTNDSSDLENAIKHLDKVRNLIGKK